jgi:hypothetical protein
VINRQSPGKPGENGAGFRAVSARQQSRGAARRAWRRFRPLLALIAAIVTGAVVLIAAPVASAKPPEVQAETKCIAINHTTIKMEAHIAPHLRETHWAFEYATTKAGPWTPVPGGNGTITQAEAEAIGLFGALGIMAQLAGLKPEVAYYVRVVATNSDGSTAEQITPTGTQNGAACETEPIAAAFFIDDPRNVTSTSAYVFAQVDPRGFETHWRIQYATSEAGPWTTVAGAEGTIGQTEAEATPAEGPFPEVSTRITGLNSATNYFVRCLGESEPEFEGHKELKHAISEIKRFRTPGGPPEATGFAVHSFHGEALRLLGFVNSDDGTPTSAEQTITIEGAPTGGTFTLTFKGQTTAPIAFNASRETVGAALQGLSTIGKGQAEVAGLAGGPYTANFSGESFAGHAQPAIEADGSGLTPSGTVTVATTQPGGEVAGRTHYHFEYVSDETFKADGETFGAGTEGTAEVEGSGAVGADLPSLKPGETYHYRVYATSTVPGNPVVRSAEQTLVVPAMPTPVAPRAASEEPCENAAFRTGFSAKLPDCRAYEQLTPVAKGGTMDIGTYGLVQGRSQVGEDGEHVMLSAAGTNWPGTTPDSKNTAYFFARTPTGWRTVSATPQPEAGALTYIPETLTPNLELTTIQALAEPTNNTGSAEVKLMLGPPGGPYATVVSIPFPHSKTAENKPGLEWSGGSADQRKWIIDSTRNRQLPGLAPTGTTENEDLYEYFEGHLKQLNVDNEAHTIGTCGAALVAGLETYQEPLLTAFPHASSPNAVSADGEHVFFYAGFGGSCPDNVALANGYGTAMHLYERTAGATTVDIGAYHFLAANAQGTELLLQKVGTGSYEDVLYDTQTATAKPLFSVPLASDQKRGSTDHLAVSADFTAVYLHSEARLTPEAPVGGGLYRYDIPGERLKFVVPYREAGEEGGVSASPDGRYFYFGAVTVGGVIAGRQLQAPGSTLGQVYRYDSVDNVVQCISCASPFNPEPKLLASYLAGHVTNEKAADGRPSPTVASSNGDFVFFETPAALVPSDIDGEIPPAEKGATPVRSPSSDTYEWRRVGVDGCAHTQGCVALISGGTGGFRNDLLGTTPSGRDVFFITHEALLSSDTDKAGDIYDARIGGGLPLGPPRPVECEGDSCSTPFAAPADVTPSSSTFQGAGNLLQASVVPVASKPAVKPPARKLCKPKGKGRSRSRCKVKGKGGRRARRTGGKRRAKR